MIFRITYCDDTRIWEQVGHWEDLPDEDVQLVELLQADGTSIVLSGFDIYYVAGTVWGGVNDEKGAFDVDGWRYEVKPGVAARLEGVNGDVPEGASVKRGRLVKDELAAAMQLDTSWRPAYQERTGRAWNA